MRRDGFVFLRLRWLLLLVAVSGCVGRYSAEPLRQEGLRAGALDGRAAGEEEGYSESFTTAERETCLRELERLRVAGEYRSHGAYRLRICIEFFAVGCFAQWMLLYLLRRVFRLPDIEWMVFPGHVTEIDIGSRFRPEIPASLTVLLALLTCSGCGGPASDAWERAYRAEYDAAYRAGHAAGMARGRAEGEESGKAQALALASTGRSWRLYPAHASCAVAAGAVIGLLAQYTYLLALAQSGQLNGLWAVILVPGIRASYAYSVFDRRRAFLLWVDEELEKVKAQERLRRSQIESARSLIHSKAATLSGLDDFVQARLLETAHKELEAILAAAESEISAGVRQSDAEHPPRCPRCGKRLGRANASATSLSCPDPECGAAETVPSARWMPHIESSTYTLGENTCLNPESHDQASQIVAGEGSRLD